MLAQRVSEVFSVLDADRSGIVTNEEFNREGMMQQLEKLGINKSILKNAFDMLDEDGSGSLDVVEFQRMIFKFLNPPQSQDIQALEYRIKKISQKLNHMACHFDISIPKTKSMPLEHLATMSMPVHGGFGTMPKTSENGLDDSPASPGLPVASNELYAACKSDSANQIGPKKASDQQSMLHPLAPVDQSPASIGQQAEYTNAELASLKDSQAQAQETASISYEMMNQLARSAEQVEDSLKLVHGWQAWEKSGNSNGYDKGDGNGNHNGNGNDETDASTGMPPTRMNDARQNPDTPTTTSKSILSTGGSSQSLPSTAAKNKRKVSFEGNEGMFSDIRSISEKPDEVNVPNSESLN